MVEEKGDPVDDFERALRRLGWLSAYARQILISRHLLRNFEAISDPFEIPPYIPGEFALDCFRVAITVLTGVNRENRKFSSPYEPLDRPDTHYLAFNRKRRIFDTSIASGMPNVTFYYGNGSSFGLESSTAVSEEDRLFAYEINEAARGTTLSTKELADKRVLNLRNEKLWRGLATEREVQAKRFFDNWHEWAGNAGYFWREWYQGFLDGTPMDWELQRRVALIADRIWEAGPEAVAEEIERIRAEWLAEKTPQAETVEFNPETAKFYTVPLDIAKLDLLGATLSQVEDVLEDVLASASNGLHDNAREVRVLQRVFRKYGNDPQQIEMGFVSVQRGLARQILKDELPASEENLALQSALEEGARAIRATHPEVAENRKILTDQAIRELPEDAKKKLEEALPVLVAISDPALAEDWEHDIPQLINDATRPLPSGAPALLGADEANRVFSRAAKISLKAKTEGVLSGIEKGSVYRAAAILLILREVVMIGLSIF